MKDNGIHVPESFESLSDKIEEIYKTLNLKDVEDKIPREMPSNRNDVTFFSSISNEMGEELVYNSIPISEIVDNVPTLLSGNVDIEKAQKEMRETCR